MSADQIVTHLCRLIICLKTIFHQFHPTYEEFEDRLLKLLKLTDEKYSEIFTYKKDYMIFHKKNNLALDIIKLEIEKIVNRD